MNIKLSNNSLLHQGLTFKVRGAIFTVYNELGFGHKENVYQKALELELNERQIPFEREKSLGVSFKNTTVGTYRPDFVIDDKIILEIKSLSSLPEYLDTQLLHYLKTTGFELGLLVNFGASKLFIKRLIWTGNPRKSSNNQRESIK